ncbi:hypothetical protein GPECTOR_27g684 [Gonium pectorale]|uniref:Ankyrin repeat domain-containing protein n=1 Tax=Gonium pectorale TaxID=33097 RepID=A0A150GFF4_GONPE|nr:hypothetical protein GPECTOR_27g684 [Gonium pectorale]|eukprot:KXZ48513.1 hypothetical protein GPECTOR_27g684 [Gonium pectorale]
MDRNEVAVNLRSVNKAAAAALKGPKHTTIRLSRPVAPHAFAAHWLSSGAARRLTLARREELLRLTAASGSTANLEVAQRATGCPLTYEVFEAAASSGKLAACRWLLERGCPTSGMPGTSGLLGAAARNGHRHVCEWLLGLDLEWAAPGPHVSAACGGHVELVEWLQGLLPQLQTGPSRQPWPPANRPGAVLVEAVAHGCDLAGLQRLWSGWDAASMDELVKYRALLGATCSPTPDWAAKVEWLEAQGCPRGSGRDTTGNYLAERHAEKAAVRADAVPRLTWLRRRGFTMGPGAAMAALKRGDVAVLQLLLTEEALRLGREWSNAADDAAGGSIFLALHAAGWAPAPPIAAKVAVRGGQLAALAWVLETFGERAVGFNAKLFYCAAASGRVEIMAWLRERGCAWDATAFHGAAGSGCEEALEWLAEQGCPHAEGCPFPTLASSDLAEMVRAEGCLWAIGARAFLEDYYRDA